MLTYKVYKNKYPAYLENYVQPYRSIYHTRRSEPAPHMLVICLIAFHIITINSTNPLRICPIVFSIQLHDCGTHFLRLVVVLLR